MYQQQIIGQNAPTAFNPMLNPIEQARTAGNVIEYQFMNIKPKKKEKELIKVLSPEPKSFLFFKFGKKFNLKDRCVVCGMHHISGKPTTHLSKTEVASLTAAGYFIKPPTLQDNRSATNEAIELVGQINILTDRLNYLMIQNGVKAPEQLEKEE